MIILLVQYLDQLLYVAIVRMRFDLSVNILTNLAIRNNKITVFVSQLRPNLHINDYANVVKLLIESEENKINGKF